MSHPNPAETIARLTEVRAVCLGDLILDSFVYGAVERISPEAPIPVLRITREQRMLGGVGNVARNIEALGAQVTLIAAVGDDEGGAELTRLLSQSARIEPNLITVPAYKTPVKTRFIAGAQQLLRADNEEIRPLTGESLARAIAAFQGELPECDVVILSDYAKGFLTDAAIRAFMNLAADARIPVIVDPKSVDFSRYAKARILTPNAKELTAATGLPTGTDEEAAAAASVARRKAGVTGVLVTRSERGMTLVDGAAPAIHFAAEAREVFDVSGAGDTVIAVLSLGVGAGFSIEESARLANTAAGIAVSKSGTAVVHPDELIHALQTSNLRGAETKIRSRSALLDQVSAWRAKGLSVGFTNGCFDLIHPGHVSLLRQARNACDRLIVALNTDASVKRLKGPDRPINTEHARATVMAALHTVDAVVLFDEETPILLIESIRPDVLIKGADYTRDKVVGGSFVESYGGKVVLADLTPGESTTGTIARMKTDGGAVR